MAITIPRHNQPIPDADGVYRDHPALGQPVSALATPAPLVDLPTLEANIATMASFFADKPARLRPHVKTHRAPAIARLQIEAGAHGITAPKVSTAEAMVDGGIDDVFIANQVVSPLAMTRLAQLAQRAKVSVLTDNPQNVKDLSEVAGAHGVTLDVLVEIDGGMGRCGTQPGEPTVELVRQIVQAPNLRFAGAHAYEGHIVQGADRALVKSETEKMLDISLETVEMIRAAGIDVETVTCGGTGTYDISGVYPGVTEHQSGSYVYMDPGYVTKVPAFGLAFSLLSTVLSRPTPNKIIVDSGLQVLSSADFPAVKGRDDLIVRGLSEEHGSIIVRDGGISDIQVGETLEVHPGHCCAAANLHDTVYGIRNGAVETVWAVTGRGRSQ